MPITSNALSPLLEEWSRQRDFILNQARIAALDYVITNKPEMRDQARTFWQSYQTYVTCINALRSLQQEWETKEAEERALAVIAGDDTDVPDEIRRMLLAARHTKSQARALGYGVAAAAHEKFGAGKKPAKKAAKKKAKKTSKKQVADLRCK